jgi:hypothetical protein
VTRTLYFSHDRTPPRYGSSSRLKHSPSNPAAVHCSHPSATAGSVVDGHSVSGASSPRSANECPVLLNPDRLPLTFDWPSAEAEGLLVESLGEASDRGLPRR